MKIKQILEELNKLGLTDAAIAREYAAQGDDIFQSTIGRLRLGVHKTTSHERHVIAEKLLKKVSKRKKLN